LLRSATVLTTFRLPTGRAGQGCGVHYGRLTARADCYWRGPRWGSQSHRTANVIGRSSNRQLGV